MSTSRQFLTIATTLLLLAPTAVARYKDYSKQGGPLSALRGLLLDAKSVQYDGQESIAVYGSSLEAAKFLVSAKVTVQTACIAVSMATFGKDIAKYELYVAEDPSFTIHDAMLEEIHEYWASKSESYLINHESLPAEKHIFYKDGKYVMYIRPQYGQEPHNLIWIEGKVVQVRFLGLVKEKGWGGDFLNGVVKFRVESTEIKSNYKSEFPPKRFLELYNKGVFNKGEKEGKITGG